MSRARTIIGTGAALALAAAAVPALASDPSSGTVSAASPTISWTGNATGYGVVPTNILVTTAGEDPLCPPEACDTFALTVADTADLTVTAAQSAGDNFTELHVVQPDGTVQYVQSEDSKAATIKVKKAATGEYSIEVLTNETAAQTGAYGASATLNVPKPAGSEPTPAPGATPTATPAPGGGPAPAEPAASLMLRTKKVSARKARKGVKLAIATSKPVTGLAASLIRGKKVVARGKRASLASKGAIKLKGKTRKLKRGTYYVAIAARDASSGQQVGLRAKLKVVK